jgi:hypothetical protein
MIGHGVISHDETNVPDLEVNVSTVKSHLSARTDRWLFVFDGFDNPKSFEGRDIRDYIPHVKGGAILVTSRHGDAKRLGEIVRVDEMLQQEGLELLFRQVGCETNDSNSMIGREIVARLGNLV